LELKYFANRIDDADEEPPMPGFAEESRNGENEQLMAPDHSAATLGTTAKAWRRRRVDEAARGHAKRLVTFQLEQAPLTWGGLMFIELNNSYHDRFPSALLCGWYQINGSECRPTLV
jgi:hypothetical protein